VSRRAVIAAAAACCVVLVQSSSAAAPLAYMTPEAMAAKLHGLVPQIPTDNTSAPSNITLASCKGLPPAHAKKFNTFRCSARWESGTSVVWARALPGGKWCSSSTGLASCPPEPAKAGDPRICAVTPPAPSTADPNRCALSATLNSIIRAMPVNFADSGWKIRNVSCTGANLTHKCKFSSFGAFGIYYQSIVTFKQDGSAWTATIVTTTIGDTGSSTCTVGPGAPSGGSRWGNGPTPTCSVA